MDGRVVGDHAVISAAGLALVVPVVTFPLAWLSYSFIELSGIQAGKRVIGWARGVSRYRQIQTP